MYVERLECTYGAATLMTCTCVQALGSNTLPQAYGKLIRY